MGRLGIETGARFDRWVVEGEAGKNKWGKWCVVARCDCGQVKTITEDSLARGMSRSCGCLRNEAASKLCASRKVAYEPGHRWGRLTLVEELAAAASGDRMMRCACDCGKGTVAGLRNLRSGHTRSCGCLAAENRKRGTHGLSESPEYNVWGHIHHRCGPKAKGHTRKNYWDKGIRVCPEWSSFEQFYADMGPRPGPGYSIERKNNALGYNAANCIWATSETQNGNKSNNRNITYMGRTMCARAWARELGIGYLTLYKRLFEHGWTVEKALSTPTRGNYLLTLGGRTMPLYLWVKETGLKGNCIKKRLELGWTTEEALTIPSGGKRSR
jgi:hypothetical protein